MKHRFHSNGRHAVAATTAAVGLLAASAVAATPRSGSNAEPAPAAVTETIAHGSSIRHETADVSSRFHAFFGVFAKDTSHL